MSEFKKGDKVIYQGVYGDLWSWRRLNGLPVLTTSEWRTIAGATGTVQSATNTRVEVRFDNSHTWWHMPEDTLQIVDATKDDDLVVEDSGAKPVMPRFSLGDRVIEELVGHFYMLIKNQDGEWMAATKISSEKFQARVESVNQNFWKLAPEMKKRDPKNPERVYWTPPSTDQVRYYWGK